MMYFLLFLVSLALSTSGQALGSSLPPGVRFAVIGDWGGLPFFPYRTAIEGAVARELGLFAQKAQIEYVLALGDNFYFDGVKNIEDPRFQETYNKVFTLPSLDIDWYFVAGNHDHHGNVSAQIAYSNLTKRWNFPNFYYKLEFPIPSSSMKIDVVMIDTVQLCGDSDHDFLGKQPLGPANVQIADAQWTWLEDTIKNSKAEYLLVAGHYPVWSVAEHGPTKILVDKLLPILHKYNATAYFSGHDHNLQHLQYKDSTYSSTVNYFVSGAANFIDPSLKHKKSVPAGSCKYHWADTYALGGFGFVDATAQNMTFTFMEASAKVLYSQTMYPRKV